MHIHSKVAFLSGLRWRVGSRSIVCIAALIISAFMWSQSTSAAVWEHRPDRVWNEQWEQLYAKWVEEELNTEWLEKGVHPLRGMKADCADFVLFVRLIFAYQHGLEFAVTTGTEIISSRSDRWNHVPARRGERVRAFAREVARKVGTSHLGLNTALVPVSRKWIRPGAILLGAPEREHVWLIKALNSAAIPHLIYASQPEDTVLFESFVFPVEKTTFPRTPIGDRAGGFRQFLWPNELARTRGSESRFLLSDAGASSNGPFRQEQIDLSDFFEAVRSRLAVAPLNADEVATRYMDEVCMKVRRRVEVTNEATRWLSERVRSRAELTARADDFSTPLRDAEIIAFLQRKQTLEVNVLPRVQANTAERWRQFFLPTGSWTDPCLVKWANNRIEPVGFIIPRFLNGMIRSEPFIDLDSKWGVRR